VGTLLALQLLHLESTLAASGVATGHGDDVEWTFLADDALGALDAF
jgi:hypothetical protein